MRRIASMFAALILLAVPAAAQAEHYNGNNLSDGTNVCPADVSIISVPGNPGQFSSSMIVDGGGGGCVVHNFFTTPLCRSTLYRNTPPGTANSGLTNCDTWVTLTGAFSSWGGTGYFRIDLTGSSYLWNACGLPVGTACSVSSSIGTLTYDCTVGEAHKVKYCTFRRDA